MLKKIKRRNDNNSFRRAARSVYQAQRHSAWVSCAHVLDWKKRGVGSSWISLRRASKLATGWHQDETCISVTGELGHRKRDVSDMNRPSEPWRVALADII